MVDKITNGAVTFPEREYKAEPATLTVTIENTTSEAISNLAVAIDDTTNSFQKGELGKTTLGNKDAANQEDKTTTFTVTPKTDLSAGEHTATVKIVKSDDTSGNPLATFTVSFKVTKKKVTVPTAKEGLVYTGGSQPGVVAEGNDGIYTLTGDTTGTNAKDSYSATATLTDSTNYEWDIKSGDKSADQTIPWEITKKTPEATDFDFTAPEKLAYDGQAKTAKVALKGDYTGAGNVTVKYYKDGTLVDEAKEPGVYTVKITVADGTNFKAATDELTAETWKFTITMVDPTAEHFDFTPPEKLTYDGQAKTAKVELKKAYTGAGAVTLKYYKDGTLVDEAKEPGVYTVKITVADGTNFNATTDELTAAAWTFTIADKRGATANVANKVISGETKVTLNQSFTITLKGGLTFNNTVKENLDVNEWFAKDNLPKGLTAKITNVNAEKKSATITLSGIPTVKSEADILITIPQNSLEGAAADMTVNMQGAKYAIKEFYMPTGGGGGGAAAKPAKPTTPEQKPATAAGKTAANTAITTAASANKYDKAEQAEVDQIVKEAEAKIKEAKTEDEVKAIQKDAETKLDKILTTEEKATIASLKEVSKRDFGTKSKKITKKNGKKAVNLSWAAPEGVDVDGYEIFRSTKKNSGYGTEPYFETPKTSYTNSKGLKSGKTYYYKVRAYVEINGERHYTDYSTKASRKI